MMQYGWIYFAADIRIFLDRFIRFFVKCTTSIPLRMTGAQSKPLKGASQYKRKLLS